MTKYFKRERVDEKSFWYYKDIPVNVIEIPDNATNLDIAKQIYGKEVAIDLYNDLTMGRKWWNAPYKRGDTE